MQLSLFYAFFRVGLFGFGGGPTLIPLVHHEVVKRYRWMDDEEFSNVLAIGNTLPGPIATKMAGYIGFKVGGYGGMLMALIALVLPFVMIMIGGLSLLNEYRDRPWVAGLAQGVLPVVAWMLARLTWDFYLKGAKGLGYLNALIMCALAAVLIMLLDVHPGILIAALLLAALLRPTTRRRTKNDAE